MAEGVRWRILNSTLRCTRNEAQPHVRIDSSRGVIYEAQLALSLLASVVALLAGLHWLTNRNGEAGGQQQGRLVLWQGFSRLHA